MSTGRPLNGCLLYTSERYGIRRYGYHGASHGYVAEDVYKRQGLIKAVNSFDPEKNIKLATYASRCIENEILMVLRRTSRLKLEVSFDEPLNTDWDGNELLLSDILGTRCV